MALESFGFYGTVGPQVEETRGFVNRLWSASSNVDDTYWVREANVLSAKVPACWDFADDLFENSENNLWSEHDALYPDARQRVRTTIDRLKASGAWAYIDWVCPIDEPNLPEHDKRESLPLALEILRQEAPGRKIAIIYFTKAPLYCMDEIDIVGFDRYKDVDRVLWDWWPKWMWWLKQYGWAKHVKRMLKPGQELLLVAGASDNTYKPARIHKWVRYAQKQSIPVHLLAFMWRVTMAEGHPFKGIAEMPELRGQYRAVGQKAIRGE